MRSFRLERKKKNPDSDPGATAPGEAAPVAPEDREPTPLEAAAAHLQAAEQPGEPPAAPAASGEPAPPAEPAAPAELPDPPPGAVTGDAPTTPSEAMGAAP